MRRLINFYVWKGAGAEVEAEETQVVSIDTHVFQLVYKLASIIWTIFFVDFGVEKAAKIKISTIAGGSENENGLESGWNTRQLVFEVRDDGIGK